MFFKEERLKSKLINNLDSIIKSINNGDLDKIFSEKILPLKLYEDYSKEVEEILILIWSDLVNSLNLKGYFSKTDQLIESKIKLLEEIILNRVNLIANCYEEPVLEKAIKMFDIYINTSNMVQKIINNLIDKLDNNILDNELFYELKEHKELLFYLVVEFKKMNFIKDSDTILHFCLFEIDSPCNYMSSLVCDNEIDIEEIINSIINMDGPVYGGLIFIPDNSYNPIINKSYEVDIDELQKLKKRYSNCSNLNSVKRVIE